MIKIRKADRLLLPVLLALGAGCEDSSNRAPLAPAEQPASYLSMGVYLLQCPTYEELSASATIDGSGGSVSVTDSYGGRHSVDFPVGAVAEPTTFTLTVPASQHMLVRVTPTDPATGAVKTVGFPMGAEPTLSISYRRCPLSERSRPSLQLYHVTESMLGALNTGRSTTSTVNGSINITWDSRVSGEVPHFSEYAVGSPEAADDITGGGTMWIVR